MGKDVTFTLKLNPDFELKQLGTIMGLPVYIDMAKDTFEEDKFHHFLQAQHLLEKFFNPPKKLDGEQE